MLLAVLWLLAGGVAEVHGEGDGRQRTAGDDGVSVPLQQINHAMRTWLDHVRADRLFLVVEQDSGRIELRHGASILRECPMRLDRISGGVDLTGRLALHMRRYRPSASWQEPRSGPFDWEDVLVTAAAADGALYFDNGLVLFAVSVWDDVMPPAARLRAHDLRALYDACPLDTPLVILPEGWQKEGWDGG